MPNENQSTDTWHIPIGTNIIFSISRIASKRLVGSEWERHKSICSDLGKMMVPIENQSVAFGTC